MAKPPATLEPLPFPVAVDPTYVAKKEETLIITHGMIGTHWRISLHDGTPLLSIARSSGWSLRDYYLKHVLDADGKQLYSILRHPRLIYRTYHAEFSEKGPHIWDLVCNSGRYGLSSSLKFANKMASGETTELIFKHPTLRYIFGKPVFATIHGRVVAVVKLKSCIPRIEYQATVAQGMDMALIIGVVTCYDRNSEP